MVVLVNERPVWVCDSGFYRVLGLFVVVLHTPLELDLFFLLNLGLSSLLVRFQRDYHRY